MLGMPPLRVALFLQPFIDLTLLWGVMEDGMQVDHHHNPLKGLMTNFLMGCEGVAFFLEKLAAIAEAEDPSFFISTIIMSSDER